MFQSTHSLRSATRPPALPSTAFPVSIHALLAECDRTASKNGPGNLKFQSTHSLRSATGFQVAFSPAMEVSIHALLAECDFTLLTSSPDRTSFNPRTPCGVRPGLLCVAWNIPCFNPRTPCGVRHYCTSVSDGPCRVSIHALLAECDYYVCRKCQIATVSIHALLAECDPCTR